jgi:hypothetical protein
VTEIEFRELLWREMENPETRRLILEIISKELRNVALTTMKLGVVR